MPIFARLLLGVVLLMQLTAAFAFETDQYNLPPVPLADIGDEVSEYTEENIRKAIAKINAQIVIRQACLENKKANCGPAQTERNKLVYLRSEEAIALEVFKLLGDGIIPFTKAGTYMNSHKFRGQPARYKTNYRQSIFVWLPTDYFTISPTVNLYGAHFGTDKIAHFFQQGYTYYRICERAAAKGLESNKAVEKAVKWGRMTERTYYGTLVGGVFSNADLYANYAGMKFYHGLIRTVKIGSEIRPSILLLKGGFWTINEKADLREVLIKPFMTDHLNEALNPSLFIVGLRSSIRGKVKKQSCPQWRKLYPSLTQPDLETRSNALKLWNGEDYGFKESQKFVTIANTCFAN